MGLQSTLWTGASGLLAYQTAIDALANNTSNINTVGFKKTDVQFSDMLYSTLQSGSMADGVLGSTNSQAVGKGVQIAALNKNFAQGALIDTGKTFDFAISGTGFFVVRDGLKEYLTRAGDFYLGATLNPARVDLLSGEGLPVQGFNAVNGVLSNTRADIVLPAVGTLMPGKESENVIVTGNLASTNSVAKGNTITAQNGWLDASGNPISDLNVGGVQTSAYLIDRQTGLNASATTKLIDLQFENVALSTKEITVWSNLFRDPLPGGTLIGRTLDIEFDRDGQTYTKSLTVTPTTTLADLSKWLCGSLGDDSSGARYDGGVLDTMYTREYTTSRDGFGLLAEQAGGFLSVDEKGIKFNIACNVGAMNFVDNIRLTANTVMENKKQNIVEDFTAFFATNKFFPVDTTTNPATVYDKYVNGESAFAMEKDKQLLYLVKVGIDNNGSTWRWYSVDNATVKENESASSIGQGTGTLRFDINGNLLKSTVDGGTNLKFDFSTITQMGSTDGFSAAADGYAEGALRDYRSGNDGVIYGEYDNGMTVILAQLLMAIVPNQNGLFGESGTLFSANEISGAPRYNTPGALPSGFGGILGGFLEESNYNLGSGEAIVYQRAYQFSARVLTVADEMLKEAIAMKK